MSIEQDYLRWRLGAGVGCFFARSITARGPAKYRQKVEVITGMVSAVALASEIADIVGNAVADKAVAASTLVIPALDTLPKLVDTSLALGDLQHWRVSRSLLQQTPGGDMVAFHITRMIPFDSVECPSEALVLGPFPCFPTTRKAPVTAMEIFVGEPMPHDPKLGPGHPTTKANVAHMDMNTQPEFWDIMWKKSVEGREKSLGTKNDDRAKAKVAFTIPVTLAKQLGCEP
jgi:hypothetical protein